MEQDKIYCEKIKKLNFWSSVNDWINIALMDEKISADEIMALKDRFNWEKEELYHALNNKKWKIITNALGEVSALKQELEQKWIKTHWERNNNPQEILSKFQIDQKILKEWIQLFNYLWLDINKQLFWYHNFIQKNNIDKTLSPNILQAVYETIWIRMTQAITKVQKIKKIQESTQWWKNNDFKNYRWIINDKIQEEFLFIWEQLLPNLAIYSKIKEWAEIDDKYYKKPSWLFDEDKNSHYINIDWFIKNIERNIKNPIKKLDWPFISSTKSWKNNINKRNWETWVFNIHDKKHSSLAKDLWVNTKELQSLSLLSEADKKLEWDIMIKYMAFIITMLVPYLWAINSIPSDIRDLFSSQEWVLSHMQSLWLIPNNYKMEKTIFDNVFWLIWIIWSIAWAQWIIKSQKFAKPLLKLERMWMKIEHITSKIDEYIKKFTQINPQRIPEWKTKFIDISWLSWEKLAKINRKITNNFPLVEIGRLVSWEKLINVNIAWVKKINDIAWQEFCDKVLWTFKEILSKKFQNWNKQSTHKWRIVKNDYKNITFVTSSPNPIETIFWNIKTKKEIVEMILKSLETEILENAKKIINAKVANWEIIAISQKHFNVFVQNQVDQTNKVIKDHFNFWVWESIIPKNADDIAKLDSIRVAEISSRADWWKMDNIVLQKLDKNKILHNLQIAIDLEKSIIEKFRWQKFRFDGIDYNVVIEIDWESRISTELLRYMRKYPDKIIPKELASFITKYINTLNNSLDFISPLRGELKIWNADFETAKLIDSQIKSWKIDSKFLTQSYKWWLTKDAFFEEILWKDWTRVFIDIKDMWIDNLVDFNLRAKQILLLEQDFKSWKIDSKTLNEKQRKLFLEAWKSVSDKFIKAQNKIRQKYPDAVFSFWWDEIYLFIPKNNLKGGLEWNLHQIFESTNQSARVIIDSTNQIHSVSDKYSLLDKMSKINKLFEENIEKQLIQKWLSLEWNIPNNTFLNIDDFILEKFMNKWFDLEKFLSKMKTTLQKQDLTKNINWKEIQAGIKLSIKKMQDNTIIIYLHN